MNQVLLLQRNLTLISNSMEKNFLPRILSKIWKSIIESRNVWTGVFDKYIAHKSSVAWKRRSIRKRWHKWIYIWKSWCWRNNFGRNRFKKPRRRMVGKIYWYHNATKRLFYFGFEFQWLINFSKGLSWICIGCKLTFQVNIWCFMWITGLVDQRILDCWIEFSTFLMQYQWVQ